MAPSTSRFSFDPNTLGWQATRPRVWSIRRTYAITEAGGLAALRSWLSEPAIERMEFRDIGELKLFFGELATTEDLGALAREQERRYRQTLAELDAIKARFGDDPHRRFRMVPLALGERISRAAAEFWAEPAENPPR